MSRKTQIDPYVQLALHGFIMGTPTEGRIIEGLFLHTWTHGEDQDIDQPQLAALTGISTRTLKRVLPDMEVKGWVVRTRTKEGTRYQATVPVMEFREGWNILAGRGYRIGQNGPYSSKSGTKRPIQKGQGDPSLHNSIRKKSKTSVAGIYTETFDTFWSDYPRQDGKKEAFKEWGRWDCDDMLVDILEAVEAQKRTGGKLDPEHEGGQFIPHAKTWLHNHRWNDKGVVQTGKLAQGCKHPPAQLTLVKNYGSKDKVVCSCGQRLMVPARKAA